MMNEVDHMMRLACLAPLLILMTIVAPAQTPSLGYDDTPLQPNGRWRIHDGRRPQPRTVTPGAVSSQPSSDAVVLLGAGDDLSHWRMQDGSPISWKIERGVLQSAKGFIETKDQFSDFQLH